MNNELHPQFLMEKFGYPLRNGPKTDHLFTKTPYSYPEQLQTIQHEALELFKKKNDEYGDTVATYGTVGVIVRIGDKITRLTSISPQKVLLVNNKDMRDTLIDLHNYAAIAIMLLDKKKTE